MGRRPLTGLQMNDSCADIAIELRRQGSDLGLERMERGVGGRRREDDRRPDADGGDRRPRA